MHENMIDNFTFYAVIKKQHAYIANTFIPNSVDR